MNAQAAPAGEPNLSIGLPAGFVMGVATSSFQIEGAAAEAGKGPSTWDTFCATAGKIVDGSNGDMACDHYHRWPEDLDLIASLGFKAYRFSIAWPRVVPAGRGKPNQAGLDFYERLVDGMLARGLDPYATLYHWDLPQPLEDAGGWTNRDTALAFADYADAVSARLGDRVKSYATLNEPWCSAFLGYAYGEHAPGRREWDACLRAIHHLLLAHGLAIPAMRANAAAADHGIVLNLTPGYPLAPDDEAAADRYDTMNHKVFLSPLFKGEYPPALAENGVSFPVLAGDLKAISAPLDFLGVNYYTRTLISDDPNAAWPRVKHHRPTGAEFTSMGWEVYPAGLTDLLLRLSRESGLPLYVTENGAAYPDQTVAGPRGATQDGPVDDADRLAYFRAHLAAVSEASRCGADVRGYFAWSLLDNFEWAFGYSKRFGIVHVDFETQARTPKRSAHWFSGLIRAGLRESL